MEAQLKKMDDIILLMEKALEKVDLYQGSKVKLPKAELDLLKTFEDSRDFMTDLVTKTVNNRQGLVDVFGGDCLRLARVVAVLEGVTLSDMNVNDQRVRTCREACETVEKVLNDMGLGWKLKEAREKQKGNLGRRRSSIDREEALKVAQQIALHEASKLTAETIPMPETTTISESTVETAPAATPKLDLMADLWAQCIDNDLVERICACTEVSEVLEFEERVTNTKASKIGNWMVWMVHRAYLNDPSLIKFDFTNLKMPDGDLEPRVAPKLAVAMEKNTSIEHLLLGCSNLQDGEAAILAVSLRSNATLKVLNIDTNKLQPLTLESIANGTSVNQALQELRCNNCATGRLVTEAFLNALRSNNSLVKLGYAVTDPYFRGEIDKQLTKNNDIARKRRLEEKKRLESGAAAVPETSTTSKASGYATAKAPQPPHAPSEGTPQAVGESSTATSPESTETSTDLTSSEGQCKVTEPVKEEEVIATSDEATLLAHESNQQSSPDQSESGGFKDGPGTITNSDDCSAAGVASNIENSEQPDSKEGELSHEKTVPEVNNQRSIELPESSPSSNSRPPELRGFMSKKSNAMLRITGWDKRYFILQGQRLLWWKTEADAGKYDPLTPLSGCDCRGFANFAVGKAKVKADETNLTMFLIEPEGGKWPEGSLKDMSDAQRVILLDANGSSHSRQEWMEAIAANISNSQT